VVWAIFPDLRARGAARSSGPARSGDFRSGPPPTWSRPPTRTPPPTTRSPPAPGPMTPGPRGRRCCPTTTRAIVSCRRQARFEPTHRANAPDPSRSARARHRAL